MIETVINVRPLLVLKVAEMLNVIRGIPSYSCVEILDQCSTRKT